LGCLIFYNQFYIQRGQTFPFEFLENKIVLFKKVLLSIRRQNMKKQIPFILLSLSALLVGCGGGNNSSIQESNSGSGTVCDTDPVASSLPDQTTKDVTLPELPSFSSATVVVHYRRSDATYKGWKLWLWVKNGEGADYEFNYQDKWGVAAAYPLTTFAGLASTDLGFIVKKGDWEAKDPDGDRYVTFSTLVASSNMYNIYLMSGDKGIYTAPDLSLSDQIESVKFTDNRTISYTANKVISGYEVKEGGSTITSKADLCSKSGTITLDADANVSKSYTVSLTFKSSGETLTQSVLTNALYKTDDFDKAYTYSGELGAIYTSEKTTFRVWSPISDSIKLRLYNKGTPDEEASPYKTVDMVKGDKGVFSVEETGDLGGKYYTYVVTNSTFANKEIVDPYAKSAGANGVRGMIVDFSKTNPDGWDSISPIQYDRKELTVWETHVADVTSSSTWTGIEANRKKYLGLSESGTSYYDSFSNTTVTTGFDHIKELGVNAVQLMPIFDSANDELSPTFNWGYNPLNYNCLDGSYSSNPKDGYTRINEFKQVVAAYNKAGINIIMDVVYNHVNGLSGSNFDVLMPGYYFRYNADGSVSNGSGCGNETASDLPMFRKFMIDSTEFWAKEYKLGGFRFDLMGLHDIDTMNKLTANLKKSNPKICVYGEPWTGGTTTLSSTLQAKQANENDFVGYGAFNDGMRDALIKGGLHSSTELGWATDTSSDTVSSSDRLSIFSGIRGTTYSNGVTVADPDKTVNYVTCHDNYTLYDRISVSGGVGNSGTKRSSVAMLAESFVFTSQGTSFMLSGDEFCRTKNNNSNSYNASYATNELDYKLKIRFATQFDFFKKLITLKKSVDGLHLSADDAKSLSISDMGEGKVIYHEFKDSTNSKKYIVYHTNAVKPVSETYDINLSGYTLFADSLGLDRSGTFTPNDYEVVIASKSLA
jgi:pullulanase